MNDQKTEKNSIYNIVIPVVITKDVAFEEENWKVYFYEEFDFALVNDKGEFNSGFVELLYEFVQLNFENNFSVMINYKTIPLLAGFFFNTKSVVLCTQNASRELFLIESLEKELSRTGNKDVFPDSVNKNYIKLKEHISKISALNPATFPSEIEKITKQHQLADLIHGTEYSKVSKVSKRISKHLIDELNRYRPSSFERLTDYCLNLTANYSILRVHLLKFLAILPSLDYDHNGHDVKRIFLESIRRTLDDSHIAAITKQKGDKRHLPFYLMSMFDIAAFMANMVPCKLFAFTVRSVATAFARRFIAGNSIEDGRASLGSLRATGRDATIDQLGELVVSEKEADNYCRNVIKIIKGLSMQIIRGEKNESNILKANVSIKISALSSDFKPEAPDYSYASVAPRLTKILLAAKEEEVYINVDAEHYSCRDLIFNIFKRVLLENDEFKDLESVGIVVQAYLRDAYTHFLDILELAKIRKITMPVRLVKGAYWDAETIEADAYNFNPPQFLNKEESDLHYRQLVIAIMKNYPHVQLCLASHNLHDHCFAEALRHLYFSDIPKIEHQCLYMTCESLSVSMAAMQWVTRNYVPVGDLLVGMGYLVRRIMENSSLVGILTIMRSFKKHAIINEPETVFLDKKRNGKVEHDSSVVSLSPDFANVSPIRFYIQNHRDAVSDQIETFKNESEKTYKQSMELHGGLHDVYSPSDRNVVVGKIVFANKDDAAIALDTSYNATKNGWWRGLNYLARSSILMKAADIMLLKRIKLATLMVFEGGKNVHEALADVDEAIDFLNFYAREEGTFKEKNPESVPRGVFAVIGPWNFPLAIPCGMVAAALVAGNSVLLKSSTQTPLIAQMLTDILHNAGVPGDVLIHLPGSGDEVGNTIVNNKNVNGIVFTGSKPVGMWIANRAFERMTTPVYNNSMRVPVKVITEMGGKNSIIVTANAELDETVSASLQSCFGHAGQKCSAASRILIDKQILDRFVNRFKEACSDISVGESFKFSSTINPVISEHDKLRLIKEGNLAIDEAVKNGGKVLVNRMEDELPGCCVGPLVLLIPASLALSKMSYAQKELFGPIVHIIPFKDMNQAVKIVNSSEYALTCGVFSQSQDDIEFIINRIESGNLYVNRGCTGARVSIEPFGGFKLSGSGPKAGHHDYLKAFHLIPAISPDITRLTGSHIDIVDQSGAGRVFKLAQPSQLKLDDRLDIIKNALVAIDEKLETIAGNKPELKRKDLAMFSNWLNSHLHTFLFSKHRNRYIAGQFNYNDHSMIKGIGLLIAYNKTPSKISLYNLIAALSVGSGITILTRTNEASDTWRKICNCFFESGLPAKNLKVALTDEEKIRKCVKDKETSFVIIDGDCNDVAQTIKLISLATNDNLKYMKSIHTPMDCPADHNWMDLLLQFVFVRSMAINTMRHGASLDIESEEIT